MYIKINALTAQKQEFVREITPNRLVVSVREKPEQNMANRRILELVALHYNISLSEIRLVSGHHKPSKIVDIVERVSKTLL